MRENRKRLSRSAANRLDRLTASGVELDSLEWTFGIPAAALEAALDEFRRVDLLPAAEEEDAAGTDAGGPPLPSPPLRRALEALGELVTATVAGYALDGAPASVPDLIRAAGAVGVRIPYPGIAPLSRTYTTGPSVRQSA
ncbi:MAG: hypothetical protein OXI64_06730 [Defluviicoccus sp.]|nr:hypothetical protein [Defluviicoccus sp.]